MRRWVLGLCLAAVLCAAPTRTRAGVVLFKESSFLDMDHDLTWQEGTVAGFFWISRVGRGGPNMTLFSNLEDGEDGYSLALDFNKNSEFPRVEICGCINSNGAKKRRRQDERTCWHEAVPLAVPTKQWVFVALSYNTSGMVVVVDGASYSWNNTFPDNAKRNLRYGSDIPGNYPSFMAGFLDNATIFKRALDRDELERLRSELSRGVFDDKAWDYLERLYYFDDMAEDPPKDISGKKAFLEGGARIVPGASASYWTNEPHTTSKEKPEGREEEASASGDEGETAITTYAAAGVMGGTTVVLLGAAVTLILVKRAPRRRSAGDSYDYSRSSLDRSSGGAVEVVSI
jgi:Concanavalin A-like lectin/glucanases superfamily